MAQPEGREAVEIFQLATKGKSLPVALEKLVPLSFIGQAAVSFYRSTIKRLPDLDMSEEQRKATLRDGQDAGIMLLAIEAKIGELLPIVEEMRQIVGASQKGIPVNSRRGGLLPAGINSNRALDARRIAKNPETVARVIAEAKENEDIPTKTAVINRIRYEKEKAVSDALKAKSKQIRKTIPAEQVEYLTALDRCLLILPQKPPRDWDAEAFKEAKSKALIIIRRLEIFRNGE